MTMNWALAIAQHYAPACGVIDKLMPPQLRSSYDAEDFVQLAIVDLLTDPSAIEYRGPSSLILLAKRRMIDVIRSPRSRVTQLRADVAEVPPSPSLELEAGELRESLVSRARPGHQLVVDLRCQGFTSTEIAELTGLGIRTVQRTLKAFAQVGAAQRR